MTGTAFETAVFSAVLPNTLDCYLDDIVDLFEGSDAPPMFWGESENIRHPYSRAELVRHCKTLFATDLGNEPAIRRTQPPRYALSFGVTRTEGGSLVASLRAPSDLEAFTVFGNLVDQLAQLITPDYAVLDLCNAARGESFLPGFAVHADNLRELGISTAGPWTYFGERVVAMVGVEVFERVVGIQQGWLKLSNAPWLEDFSVLRPRVDSLNHALDVLGLRVNVVPPGIAQKGNNWVELA